MPAATLKKRRRPPITDGDGAEDFEEDRSASFFMPAGTMTLAQFRAWTYSADFPEQGLIAYIGKEIFVDMSPERLTCHGAVKTEVCTVVNGLVRKKKSGRFYFDRSRLANVPAEVSNEPDGLFATWKSFKTGKIRLVPTKDEDDYLELEGTPDWLLEIVSPSSVTKDKKKLRLRYHRAGVPEYWLIDARGDELDFQILVHGSDDYEPAERDGAWQISPTFGKKFRLRRLKDELGGDAFRLDVK